MVDRVCRFVSNVQMNVIKFTAVLHTKIKVRCYESDRCSRTSRKDIYTNRRFKLDLTQRRGTDPRQQHEGKDEEDGWLSGPKI